jgi:cobalt-precorrin 5A hydrolase
VIAGIGCRRGADAAAILCAVALACARAACQADALASPLFKSKEAGLVAAAQRLGVELIFVDDASLAAAEPRCATRSARAERATGFASVAEASALAAAGPEGRLLVPRIAAGTATCALAEGLNA